MGRIETNILQVCFCANYISSFKIDLCLKADKGVFVSLLRFQVIYVLTIFVVFFCLNEWNLNFVYFKT